jgi:phosphoglycolate phosphatase
MKPGIKAVAFDCDGVMFDSAKANTAYYNQILIHFGRPPMTREQFAYTHMHAVRESMEHLFQDTGDLEAAEAYRRQMSYMPFIRHMEIEPHLRGLLAWLKPRYQLAVATNRSDTMDRVLIEHDLEGIFDLVVSALDVPRPKPAPDALLKVVSDFAIAPQEMLYIGDSQVDQIAAEAAGVPLVAYDNPALSAAFHIQNLGQIEALLTTHP